MFKLEITPRAERLILNTIDFYNNRRKNEGNKFYDEIIMYFELISKRPEIFQIRYKNVRVATMRNHPYLIFYIITNKIIHVLAVIHSSEDMKKWPIENK